MIKKISINFFTGSSIVILIVSMSLSQSTFALKIFNQASISLGSAKKLARHAMRECRNKGFPVSVAVVDASGVLLTHIRDNRAGPDTVNGAFRKAFTANSLRASTGDIAEAIVNSPTNAGIQFIDNLLAVKGGLPITRYGNVVGGVGVAGAPSGDIDEECAQKGIQSLD